MARELTNPIENTNEPTPKSIREVPQVSTLANLLGKTLKSTAKIAKLVIMSMWALYAVMNDFLGRSCFSADFSCLFSFWLVLSPFDFHKSGKVYLEKTKISKIGTIMAKCNVVTLSLYKVISTKMGRQLRMKS